MNIPIVSNCLLITISPPINVLKGPDGFIPFGPLLLSAPVIHCFHETQHLPVLSKGKTSFQVVCRDLHIAVFFVQDFDHAVVPEGGEAKFSAAFQAEGNVFDIRGQTVGQGHVTGSRKFAGRFFKGLFFNEAVDDGVSL